MRERRPTAARAVETYGDLAVVVLGSGLTVSMADLGLDGGLVGLLRVPVGFLFVFVLPGYALTAAMFPRANDGARLGGDRRRRAVTPVERAVLTVGLSIAVVPLTVLFWNFTPGGIRTTPVLVGIAGVAVAAAVIAAVRRFRTPAYDRFQLRYGEHLRRLRRAVVGGGVGPRGRNTLPTLVLSVMVVISVTGLGVALVTTEPGERYTEFYLLTENESEKLVAAGYPTEVARGNGMTFHLGIVNRERRAMNYTVVVELQRVSSAEGGVAAVTEERELALHSVSLGAGETYQRAHDVRPVLTGQNLRLAFLLYQGPPPSDSTTENAYREVHLWLDVTEPA